MKNMNKIPVLIFLYLFGIQAWAGSLTIPNTFVDGTTASAKQVNSNFNAVKTEVNDNNTRITSNTSSIRTNAINIQNNASSVSTNTTNIGLNAAGILSNANAINANAINIGINAADIATNVTNIQTNATNIQANTDAISNISSPRVVSVLVNDARVGTYLGSDNDYFLVNATTYYTLLDSEYLAGIKNLEDNLYKMNTYYVNTGCNGQAYIKDTSINGQVARQGVVFSLTQSVSPDLYYVPKGTPPESITTLSYMSNGCNDVPDPGIKYKAYPNDPVVTGVTKTDFIGAVTLGY